MNNQKQFVILSLILFVTGSIVAATAGYLGYHGIVEPWLCPAVLIFNFLHVGVCAYLSTALFNDDGTPKT